MPKFVETTWECWGYDVWGNARDGYTVNDRHCFNRELKLRLTVVTYNQGTPQEWQGAHPTNKQICKVFGIPRKKIEVDGDDLTVYVAYPNGFGIGEMHCTSHASLSPIRKMETVSN